jgi:branched-subunit amino acid transport protein
VVENEYLYILFGMSIATFVPRLLPVFFLSGRTLPDWFIEWLDLIPSAVLSALLLPALVTTGVPRTYNFYSLETAVAVPTFIIAVKTKSLGATVMTGMGLYWLLDIMLTAL